MGVLGFSAPTATVCLTFDVETASRRPNLRQAVVGPSVVRRNTAHSHRLQTGRVATVGLSAHGLLERRLDDRSRYVSRTVATGNVPLCAKFYPLNEREQSLLAAAPRAHVERRKGPTWNARASAPYFAQKTRCRCAASIRERVFWGDIGSTIQRLHPSCNTLSHSHSHGSAAPDCQRAKRSDWNRIDVIGEREGCRPVFNLLARRTAHCSASSTLSVTNLGPAAIRAGGAADGLALRGDGSDGGGHYRKA